MERETAIQVYRQYNVAMGNCDVATLKRLLSPHFTLTHMTGMVQPVEQWLIQITNGQMHYFSSKEQHVSAHAEQGGWQVIGDNVVNAQIYHGARRDWRLHTVMQISDQSGTPVIERAVVTPY